MSGKAVKASPADIAANIALAVLAAAIAVLLCIYFFKINGNASDEDITPHVIGGNEVVSQPVSTTEPQVTEPPEVTEPEPETTITVGEFDEEFFDNVLVIGDSLSTGFVNYEYLKPENVFAQAGITPSSVMTTEVGGTSVYAKASSLSPEYICIMLGTNGISYLEADFMSEKMSIFIDELEQKCPDSEIILVSIPPVTAAHESEKPEKLESITVYNEHIRKLAEEKGVLYVDTYSLLCDETGYLGSDYAETDGLHLKIHAYPVILSAIQYEIENNAIAEEPAAETTAVSETSAETESISVTEESTSILS